MSRPRLFPQRGGTLLSVTMLQVGRELDLVGVAEIALMLDTSRAQVSRWALRDDFPKPVARLRMGPIWMRADVERWAKQRKPNGRRKR
jgi:predicted DNA-binding transcriptional regulator AlpA